MKIKKTCMILISSLAMSTNFIYAYVDASLPSTEHMATFPLVKEMHYQVTNVMDSLQVYEYNSAGNIVRKSFYTGPDGPAFPEDPKPKKGEPIIVAPTEYLSNGLIDYRRKDKVQNYTEQARTIYDYQYNTNGLSIIETNYSLNSMNNLDAVETKTYQYDTNGKLLKYELYVQNSLINSKIYEYDILKTTTYVYDSLNAAPEAVVSDYNPKGNVVKETFTTADQTVVRITKYDEYDNITQISDYLDSEKGPLINRSTYEYDSRGDQIKINRTPVDQPTSFEIFEYDDNHNLIRHNFYINNQLNKYYLYSYDIYGNKITERYYMNGVLQHVITNAYDSAQNIVRHEQFFSPGNLKNFFSLYTYEDTGNVLYKYDFRDNGVQTGYTLYNYAYGSTALN